MAFAILTQGRRSTALVAFWLTALTSWPHAAEGATTADPASATPAGSATTQTVSQPARPSAAPGRQDRRVYGARLSPHWFADNSRFWYRNDLPGGKWQFVAVDAAQGARKPAFDHAAVAQHLAGGAQADRLPIEDLQYGEDGQTLFLAGREHSYRLNLTTGKLEEAPLADPAPGKGLLATREPRPSRRTGPESEVRFVNRLDEAVSIFWLDDQGARRPYGKIEPGAQRVQHTYAGHCWLAADGRGEVLAVFEAASRPDVAIIDGRAPRGRPAREGAATERDDSTGPRSSPDGKWAAYLKDDNVFIHRAPGAEEIQLSHDGSSSNYYSALTWSPDSKTVIAWRVELGERKPVFLVRSSPPTGGRAELEKRPYAQAGDRFSRYELNLFQLESFEQRKPAVDRFEHEWETPRLHWSRDQSHFSYRQVDRGHQRLRVIEVDPKSGAVRNLIDETSKTFIWTAHTESLRMELVNWLERTDELIYLSERDGWRHLYLVDGRGGGIVHQITHGDWVVRGIEFIDEPARQICFSAGGRNADQDPYYLHFYRVNFDGSGLVALTEGDGTHAIEFSPDRHYLIDTWSRVDAAPVHQLRRVADGQALCLLERADTSELEASGWVAPEAFAAKGRDGKTEIFGLIHRPAHLDPAKKHPVIEYIYAGPQGSYVPKSFSAVDRFETLTSLGFVVVQIDGMGTANRSKAFHDVCFKNLKDAGFADRILWLQAAAAKYPYLDLSRVGIYGNSAGGQNAAAAVLFHPEFYKAAVASCGCHDNRLDKASWNEQWMGFMPPEQIWSKSPENWYAQSSNIENAYRLEGKLFLIVGEMDTNVPPESTLRLADALIRAGKDFDLLVIPNGGHGMGGAYGERRMVEFFRRHLL